jgi:NitT/TauT family transport system substrate-binding protein
MGSAGEFSLGRFLAFNGISMDEVELLDVGASDMEAAIGNGEVDAVMTWEPYVYEIKQRLGDEVVSWPGDNDQDSSFILITTEDWLAAHADTAERFLAALLQAEDYVLDHDNEARDFIAQRFGYDPVYWASVWPKYAFRARLSQTLIIAMEDEARWRIEIGSYGEVTEVPNYLEFIDFGPLDATRPDAIRIIR